MRKIYTSFFVVVLLISSCSIYEELPSDYDYSFKGKFRTYDTFDFFSDGSSQNIAGPFSKESIENVIAARMRSQGYKQKDKNPNLLVMYKIFYDSLSLTGYKQPELEEWIRFENEDLEYIERKYQLRLGTLYISFFDRKQRRTVWQGYATKVYGNDMFTNERLLRNAVRSVLNRYKVVSESFSRTIKEKRF